MKYEAGRNSIREFTDLLVWQEGHKVVIMTYEFCKTFPESEAFGLVSQMRRAAVSITSNIAEGFGRRGVKEKIQFYYVAHGSLTELKNLLIISRDIGYLSQVTYEEVNGKIVSTQSLLQGLLRSTKNYLAP